MQFTKENNFSLFAHYRTQIATGGEALLVPTDGNHIHFDANHHSANGRPGDRCYIVCRGIEYGASIHFQRVDGEWTVGHTYTSRCNTFTNASPAATKWIQTAALAIVQEFAQQHAAELAAAALAQVTRDLEGKREELRQAKRKVEELEQQVLELEHAAVLAGIPDISAR